MPAPKVVVVLNDKGGVSTTTVTCLTAEFLALHRNRRVLLIDFDGQCNLTSCYIGHDEILGLREPPIHPDISDSDLADFNRRSAITDIFLEGKAVEPYRTYIGPESDDDMESPRIELVACSGSGMEEIRKTTQEAPSPDVHGKQLVRGFATSQIVRGLHDFCHAPELGDLYDVILIDTGPGISSLFVAALESATHVIAPYIPEDLSILGLSTLAYQIEKRNRAPVAAKQPAKLIGILPSKVDTRNPYHKEKMTEMREAAGISSAHFPEGLFVPASVHISRRCKPERPPLDPYSIFQMKPSAPVRVQCEKVFGYIHDQIFDDEPQQEVQHG